jgi:hypothetical protein
LNTKTSAGFETFRRSAVTSAGTPLVAIHKRKLFALNQPAYELLGKPEAVELLFNPGNRLIGFRPSERSSPDSYAVRHHTKFSHQVEGRAFFNHYSIPEEVTAQRYEAELTDDGILTIDLNKAFDEDGNGSGGGP